MTTDSTACCSTEGCMNSRSQCVYTGRISPTCDVCLTATVASMRQRPDDRVQRFLGNIVVMVLGLSMAVGGLFLFVQFVKWAWNWYAF
jgi:hypothetical protein